MIFPSEIPGPLIAHRGASLDAPENTLSAYQLAADSGFNWLEVDTQLSRDGVAVMMHDPTLDRTTNGEGYVCSQDLDSLKTLDASLHHPEHAPEAIPTLLETISLCLDRSIGLILEMKPIAGQDMQTGTAVARLLNDYWPRAKLNILVTSFSASCLLSFRQQAPWVPLGLATDVVPDNPDDYIDLLGVSSFHVNFEFALLQGIDKLLDSGVHIAAATVNDIDTIEQLLAMGVHGVMSDRRDIQGMF